ncbi:MAG TPA: Arc family DNA-binding protein [Dehalococcoidia bacterium]|nr:Arc family DNA-binding protein [Dehalococcoidia bacterium]
MTQADDRQHAIDLDSIFAALAEPLALIDSPERRAEVERYLQAARVHLERAVFVLLSQLVDAVNAAGGRKARLQYEGGRLRLAFDAAAQAEPDAPEADAFFSVEGDMEKVTIRLPKELKELIDQAATHAGRSANSWYIRELARAIARHARGFQRHGWPGGPSDAADIGADAPPPPPGWQGRRRFGSRLKGFVGDE